jgi:dipeptidyl aminopeptidase/acylaminoacyl peptidase
VALRLENQIMHHRHIPALSMIALAAAAVLGFAAPSQAAFPGRNGKIAVSFFNDPGGGAGPARSGIALLRADRGPAQKRSEVIACTDDRRPPRECLREYASPAFSPNGRWIAFDAGRRIAVVRTNGTGRHLLPAAGVDPRFGYESSPAWSPNGKRIVFDAPRAAIPPPPRAVTDLYVVAADGSGRAKRVVRNAADPSWSVDGLLAFERPSTWFPSRPHRIVVSRSDGTHARAVSSGTAKRPDFSADPDFSPDGSRIVYYAGAKNRLAVVRTNGRGTRLLAAPGCCMQRPAWSPNGHRLAWWNDGIYVARADGSHARLIARNRAGPMNCCSSSTYAPSWQPLPPFSTR